MSDRQAFARTLILGNSGSGKSWLATRLAQTFGVAALDLDAVHWLPGGYGAARDKHEALAMVRAAAEKPAWIMEGVYGWLAEAALPETATLIWLTIPTAECLDNLRQRGIRRGGNEASFNALLEWAADYEGRRTSSSLAGHAELFASFTRQKIRLSSRGETDQFLASMSGSEGSA